MSLRSLALALALVLPGGLAAAQPAPLQGVKALRSTDVATKPMIGAIGDTVPLRATLVSKVDGQPLAGRRIAFRVAGHDAGDALTGPTGEVKVDFKVPSDPAGSYPLEARFTGDANHGPSVATSTFGVVKAATHMIGMSDPKVVNEGDAVNLIGRLDRTTDEGGLDGRAIAVMLNGQPVAKVATDHGNFSWKWAVPKGAPSKASVRFQFDGDALYTATGAAIDFAVRPPARPAILSFQGESGKVGSRSRSARASSSRRRSPASGSRTPPWISGSRRTAPIRAPPRSRCARRRRTPTATRRARPTSPSSRETTS